MSNRRNHRRGEGRRTESGPRWESHNPGEGCNSTHVARARKAWLRLEARKLRRTGTVQLWIEGRRMDLPDLEES